MSIFLMSNFASRNVEQNLSRARGWTVPYWPTDFYYGKDLPLTHFLKNYLQCFRSSEEMVQAPKSKNRWNPLLATLQGRLDITVE